MGFARTAAKALPAIARIYTHVPNETIRPALLSQMVRATRHSLSCHILPRDEPDDAFHGSICTSTVLGDHEYGHVA